MLSKENAEKLVFGGIYTADPKTLLRYESVNIQDPWDQRYKHWIPIYFTDGDGTGHYAMVNCYQVERLAYGNTKAEDFDLNLKKLEGLSNDGSGVYYQTHNYYYRSATILSDESIELFRLVADLHDYRWISARDAGNYNEEDVLRNIRLYSEHAYPDGICLVKKDAQEVMSRKIDSLIEDLKNSCGTPFVPSWKKKELLDLIDEAEIKHLPFDIKKARAFVVYIERLEQIQKEYNEIYDWYRNTLRGGKD